MKYYYQLLVLFIALFTSSLSFAQTFSVSGKILDENDLQISYANVVVMSQDSTVVTGTSSNDDGFFKINNIQQDDYLLKLSFLGFKDVFRALTIQSDVDLGAITMQIAAEDLIEISVIAKRPTLKKEADRLTFNIENTALSEGNMFQVLKSTPGILIIDNNIQVKNTTPTVYINNKKVHLSSDELVQLLEGSSASSIKSIEVITNPSAKYDAESGAVINIVMSKNLITGYRGSLFGNYTQGVFPIYNAGMSNYFKSEKINFFGNYSYTDSKINRNEIEQIHFFDTDQSVNEIRNTKINRQTKSKTHNLNFNIDYSFDDKNMLSVSSNVLWMPSFDYQISSKSNITDANENLDYYFNAHNQSNDDKYNLGFDLDFIHQFKKAGEKLSFNSHYTTYNYNRYQDVFSNYYNNDDTFIMKTAFNTDNNQEAKIFIAKADYSLPISETSTIEAGVKASNIRTNSDITQFDTIDNEEVLNVDNTDAFDYDEDVLAAYLNFTKEWDKVNLVAGLRAEQTNVKGVSLSNLETNKQDYLEWFPTASLSFQVTDNFSLYTNYKRSIQRPNYENLNPFQFFKNDQTIVTGNPDLKPVFVDHAVIGSSFYQRFTVEAYYKIYKNNIFELPLQNNTTNQITYTPVNLDKTTEFGFDFVTYFDVVNNWSVYFVTSFYNLEDQGIFGENTVKIDQWSNYSVISNDLTLLRDRSLNVNFSLTYVSKNIQGLIIVEDRWISDLSLSKTILGKKGVLSLSISDLFNQQDFHTSTRYLNQYNSNFTDQDTRTIKLGFRYKFGNTTLRTNQRTSQQQETDRL